MITKEEAQKRWRQLLAHKKAFEQRAREYENIDIYQKYGTV